MILKEQTLEATAPAPEGLPVPHRCPFWMQYMLVSPLRRWAEPPHKLVGPYVSPGMTVLDPGCGFGFFSLPLARMVGPQGKVVAVDVEQKAVSRLMRRAKRAGLAARIDARVCGPLDLGLTEYERAIDLVTVIHTLHEFDDLPGFLNQVAHLLKVQGRLLVVEPSGHVRADQFQAELKYCCQAGFVELESPDVGKKRLAALLSLQAV